MFADFGTAYPGGPLSGKAAVLRGEALEASGDVTGAARAYLDADIVCSPPLMAEIIEALSPERPVYASGTLVVAPARSWMSLLMPVRRCASRAIWRQRSISS